MLHLVGPSWMKKKISGWRREKIKDIPANSESTYKNVNEARELKMPGSSSVRSFPLRFLKATRSGNNQSFRVGTISRPVVHHNH